MIKIFHKDAYGAESEYFNKLKAIVTERISALRISLGHLNGETVDVDHSLFLKFKHSTRKTMNILETSKFTDKFDKLNYNNTITSYLNRANKLNNFNVKGLIDLLDVLITPIELRKLLICKPTNLETLNNDLLKSYKLHTAEIPIIRLAFDYEYLEINEEIKRFFRKTNFVKFCPYCNLEEVQYMETDTGKPASIHELDHFFDKVNAPLLAFSMYNLIPTHFNCNGNINKGSTLFSDEFHLNPYSSGFGKHMKFEPKIGNVSKDVEEIELFVSDKDVNFRKKLIGQGSVIDEGSEYGNINVFKLKTRYRTRRDQAKFVLKEVQKTDSGLRSIRIFLTKLGLSDHKANYIKWYEENIRTSFMPERFHENGFSKLNRDIHDYYYSKNNKFWNRYIEELISENID